MIKKFFVLISLYLLSSINSFAKTGSGEVYLSQLVIDKFVDYIKLRGSNRPYLFVLNQSGNVLNYGVCPEARCQAGIAKITNDCNLWSEKYDDGSECRLFAKYRTIKWKNGINTGKGASKISKNLSREEIIVRLTELGFIKNNSNFSNEKENKKITKKTNDGYELIGNRSIALNWQNYNDLIAGTIEFDEKNYSGKIILPLPNKDGNCTGSYNLQKNGKGTWQISCTNDMGAAGTLKWIKDGGVTGQGRDYNDNKVKFTVSSQG